MTGNDKDDLSARIERAKAAREARLNPDPSRSVDRSVSAGAMALRYSAEFGVSVGVGIMFGLLIDHYFGTKPWGLLIMLGFGLAAGMINVIRAYRMLTAQATSETDGAHANQDEKNAQ